MTGAPNGVPPKNTSTYTAMTRPRIDGVDSSWHNELADVVMVRIATPVGTSKTQSAQYDGMNASANSSTPKTNAEPYSKVCRGRGRRAAPSAPIRQPNASAADSVP